MFVDDVLIPTLMDMAVKYKVYTYIWDIGAVVESVRFENLSFSV